MNRNFLCLPEAIGTTRNDDREEDAIMSYIKRSGQSTVRDLTKNKPNYDVKFAAPSVRENELNFGTSADGSMLESRVVHSDIMSAQNRIAKNREHGSTFKERIQNYKRFTYGEIFRNDSSRLVQTILDVQRERKEDARVKQEGLYKKNKQEYRDNKQYINKLLTSLV